LLGKKRTALLNGWEKKKKSAGQKRMKGEGRAKDDNDGRKNHEIVLRIDRRRQREGSLRGGPPWLTSKGKERGGRVRTEIGGAGGLPSGRSTFAARGGREKKKTYFPHDWGREKERRNPPFAGKKKKEHGPYPCPRKEEKKKISSN